MKTKILNLLAISFMGLGLGLSSCGNNQNNQENNEPTINDKSNYITSINLEEDSKTVGVGSTFQLKWTVDPVDASNKEVTFSSSDDSVATVDDKGLITALKIGTTTITISSADDGDAFAKFSLVVEESKYITKIKVKNTIEGRTEHVAYYDDNLILTSKTEYQLEWDVLEPADYNDNRLYFYSLNSSKTGVTIDEKGYLMIDREKLSNYYWGNAEIYILNPDNYQNLQERIEKGNNVDTQGIWNYVERVRVWPKEVEITPRPTKQIN